VTELTGTAGNRWPSLLSLSLYCPWFRVRKTWLVWPRFL